MRCHNRPLWPPSAEARSWDSQLRQVHFIYQTDYEAVASLYDRIVNPNLLIRRLTLTTNHVISEESARTTSSTPIQLDLFTDYEALEATT